MSVEFTLNGKMVEAEADPTTRLLDVLREDFDLIAAKEGCGEGECGACTVLMDGRPVLSCIVPLFQVEGREIVTVEGVMDDAEFQRFLQNFVEHGATQCGACTPAIVLVAWQLRKDGSSLRREDLRMALAGNICRCTGYEAILRALEEEEAS